MSAFDLFVFQFGGGFIVGVLFTLVIGWRIVIEAVKLVLLKLTPSELAEWQKRSKYEVAR